MCVCVWRKERKGKISKSGPVQILFSESKKCKSEEWWVREEDNSIFFYNSKSISESINFHSCVAKSSCEG